MDNNMELNWAERLVAERLNDYFRSPHMSLRDKIFHASLIAQHELDAHNFANELERKRVVRFKMVLDNLERKYRKTKPPLKDNLPKTPF
jgi:hypothetical protein